MDLKRHGGVFQIVRGNLQISSARYPSMLCCYGGRLFHHHRPRNSAALGFYSFLTRCASSSLSLQENLALLASSELALYDP